MTKAEKTLKILFWPVEALVFALGAYGAYKQYINPMAPTLLLDWSWCVWLVIFLLLIILRLLWEVWSKKESISGATHTESKKSNIATTGNNSPVVQATDGGTAIGNLHLSQTYLASEDRTKKDLRLQIGIELQVFQRAFQDVVSAHSRDLREIYEKADKILENLTSDLFFRANLLLTNTPIPAKLVELRKYYDLYSEYLFIHHSVEEEIRSYIIKGRTMAEKRSKVPPELDEEEQHLRISVDTNQLMVQYIIGDILKLCKE